MHVALYRYCACWQSSPAADTLRDTVRKFAPTSPLVSASRFRAKVIPLAASCHCMHTTHPRGFHLTLIGPNWPSSSCRGTFKPQAPDPSLHGSAPSVGRESGRALIGAFEDKLRSQGQKQRPTSLKLIESFRTHPRLPILAQCFVFQHVRDAAPNCGQNRQSCGHCPQLWPVPLGATHTPVHHLHSFESQIKLIRSHQDARTGSSVTRALASST